MKIVLISYLNRSGSTFLVNQLSKIPQVCICPEADILYELLLRYSDFKVKKHHIKKWKSLFELDYKFKTWKIPIDSIINQNIVGKTSYLLFLEILIAFQKVHFPNCNILIFKQNYLYKAFNKLSTSYSDYKFYSLILIRDPRGIYSSQKSTITPQTNKKMSTNPLQFIKEWDTYIEQAQAQIIFNNQKILVFENLILNFNNTMNILLYFLGLENPYSNYNKLEAIHTSWINKSHESLHPNINNPPILNNIKKWNTYLTEMDLKIITLFCKTKTHYFFNKIENISTIQLLAYYIYFSFLRIKTNFIKYMRRIAFKIKFIF